MIERGKKKKRVATGKKISSPEAVGVMAYCDIQLNITNQTMLILVSLRSP